VTMRDTGEHVKVELWSAIAGAYRVHSSKGGLQFAGEADLEELCAHPEAHHQHDGGDHEGAADPRGGRDHGRAARAARLPRALAPVAGEGSVVVRGQIVIEVVDGSGRGHVEATEDVEQRRLSAAGGAQQNHELACEQIQINATQRVHVDFAHVIHLRDPPRLEDRFARLIAGARHGWYGRCASHGAAARESGRAEQNQFSRPAGAGAQ